MLKRSATGLLAGAAVMSGISLAFAADLSVRTRTAVQQVYAPVPALTWTGFYAGANVGYGWSSGVDPNFTSNMGGVIGGGQIGYNWQTGMFVVGIEGDFQGSDQHHSDTGSIGGRPSRWIAAFRGSARCAVASASQPDRCCSTSPAVVLG